MELIKSIIILDPPSKYVDRRKNKIDEKTGKLKETTYYLTANLFYASQNTFLTNKVVDVSKSFLYDYFKDLPKLCKMNIEIIYCKNEDNFDLDNKGYFWLKCILDLIKEPNKRKTKKKFIQTIKPLNIIQDDSCKFIKDISLRYKKEVNHKMIVNIYGELFNEQTLF